MVITQNSQLFSHMIILLYISLNNYQNTKTTFIVESRYPPYYCTETNDRLANLIKLEINLY